MNRRRMPLALCSPTTCLQAFISATLDLVEDSSASCYGQLALCMLWSRFCWRAQPIGYDVRDNYALHFRGEDLPLNSGLVRSARQKKRWAATSKSLYIVDP